MRRFTTFGLLLILVGCGSAGGGGDDGSTTKDVDTGEESGDEGESDDQETDDDSDGPRLDVGFETDGGGDACKVTDDMDGVGTCEQQAPPDSFEPDVQWSWTGDVYDKSATSPLVANLTDDDDDGEIDLCDTPDIVVVAYADLGDARIHVFDGETGDLHFVIDHPLDGWSTPALGDIDDDGLPEIVTLAADGKLVAFEHDGSLAWESDWQWGSWGIALADLDNDGDVEILSGSQAADHEGNLLWFSAEGAYTLLPTAADLDGDDDLEVIHGALAFHHDGSIYYDNDEVRSGLSAGWAQVADLDDDPDPEILVMNCNGIGMLEHDGTTKYDGMTPTGDPVDCPTWQRPATIHDFDGDGDAEFAVSSASHYAVYEQDASILWSAAVDDDSGAATGTAFDFLGDGTADAMYADEHLFHVFDGTGAPLMQVPRTSFTAVEYPVVADVDDDGSAEIVVVSNEWVDDPSPTVQVVRDVDDRWIQARRIWNQHTYHVTNVREDGVIPTYEPKHWQSLNTFRTQAQIEGGGLCQPDPEG